MLWRFAIYFVVAAYVVYRITVAVRIHQARRVGDVERERRLRHRSLRLIHFAIVAGAIGSLLAMLLVWSNSR